MVLKNVVELKYYEHFLLLTCAVRILSHPEDCETNNDCASEMLKEFVGKFTELYGVEDTSYNIHSLLHLADDVKLFGHLDSYSAFKFENFMQILKKMVKKSSFPIQQIRNRLNERNFYLDNNTESILKQKFNFTNKSPNNYCGVGDKVLKIYKSDNNIIEGKFLKNLNSYFNYPIPSDEFLIFCCNKESYHQQMQTLKIHEITSKYVKLELHENIVIIPLQHY